MFSHNGLRAHHVFSEAAIEYEKHSSQDSNQISLNEKTNN